MAFVYRSPRNLDSGSPSCHAPPEVPPVEESPCKDNKSKKLNRRIVKGPTCKTKEEPLAPEKYFCFAKDPESIPKSSEKSPHSHEHKKKISYFFKSKSKRGFLDASPNCLGNESKDEISQESIIHKVKEKRSKSKDRQVKEKKLSISKNQSPAKQEILKTTNKNADHKKIPVIQSKESVNNSSNGSFNLLHSKKQCSLVFTVPSIPGKDEKFGYVFKGPELHYPQMVPKIRYNGEKNDLPGPTDYEYSPKTKIKCTPKFCSPSHSQHKKSNEDAVKYAALINDQEALQMHNEKIKEWVAIGKQKKEKKTKEVHCKRSEKDEVETRALSNCSEESAEIEYEYDTTPGPGYYDYSLTASKNCFRSKQEKFSKIFLSQSTRFAETDCKAKIPIRISQQDTIDEENKRKNCKFFISKLKRDFKLQHASQYPPPGHYDTRVGLENDVITNIVKNSPKLFNNNLPRLAKTVMNLSPGPAHYEQTIPNFTVESFPPLFEPLKYKVSQSVPKLKSFQQILVQNHPRPSVVQTIHHRDGKSDNEPKRAPFLSSHPRSMNLNQELDYQTELPKPTFGTASPKPGKENRVPFNSSQGKGGVKRSGQVAEVGLYQLENLHGWEKKSYNIIFN